MGSQTNQRLTVAVYGENGQVAGWPRDLGDFGGLPVAYQWKWYTVPLSQLGAAGRGITGIVIQDGNGWAQPTAQIDELKLTNVASGLGLAPPARRPAARRTVSGCRHTPRSGGRTPGERHSRASDDSRYFSDLWAGAGTTTGSTAPVRARRSRSRWAARSGVSTSLTGSCQGHGDPRDLLRTRSSATGGVGSSKIHRHSGRTTSGHVEDGLCGRLCDGCDPSYYDGASWTGKATRGYSWIGRCVGLRLRLQRWGWYANAAMSYNDTKPWKRAGQPRSGSEKGTGPGRRFTARRRRGGVPLVGVHRRRALAEDGDVHEVGTGGEARGNLEDEHQGPSLPAEKTWPSTHRWRARPPPRS